jgi:multicomponent Na+:H+ antiporter subunit E
MNLFLLNLVFASVFTILLGSGDIGVFLGGFALGSLVLWVTQPLYPHSGYLKKLPLAVNLFGFFLRELVVSNLRVLWDVITPRHISRPGIIGVPLRAETDMEIFLVANLISLTPGTLSVDLSPDRRILYVHIMFLDDPDAAREAIRNGLERRVLEVTRS